MVTRQIRVSGRVQGVGYRYAMRAAAQRLGVSGWARNRADGSVEAMVQGSAEAVEKLIDWARRGPAGAKVAGVEVQSCSLEGFKNFEILPTL